LGLTLVALRRASRFGETGLALVSKNEPGGEFIALNNPEYTRHTIYDVLTPLQIFEVISNDPL